MNKTAFLNFILKYNLSEIDKVKYFISEKIQCKFTNHIDLLGTIILKEFKNQKDISGNQLGIQNSSKLESLVKILNSDEIEFDVLKVGDKPVLLSVLDDRGALVEFPLHDMAAMPVIPELQGEPKEYEIEIKLDDYFKSKFIEAASAMSKDGETVSVSSDGNTCLFVIGQKEYTNSTRVTLQPKCNKSEKVGNLVFRTDTFKNIFVANKNIETVLYISSAGLAKVSFEDTDNNITSKYYIKKIN